MPQKATDLGTAVALVWFIFKMVSVVDFQLKKWAALTDSTIDHLLSPLVGNLVHLNMWYVILHLVFYQMLYLAIRNPHFG